MVRVSGSVDGGRFRHVRGVTGEHPRPADAGQEAARRAARARGGGGTSQGSKAAEAIPAPARRTVAGFPAVPQPPTSADHAKAARDRRLTAEAAPPRRSETATWPDPDDKANTRTPKVVKGRQRGVGSIARLYRRNSPEITREHVEAAHRLLLAWNGATIGYSGRSMTGESSGHIAAGPSQGPKVLALRQLDDARTVARAFRAVGPAAAPMLRFIVIENHDVASWAVLQEGLTGKKPCPKCCMGRLLSALDILVVALDVPAGDAATRAG